jgi:hypothetical protein
MKRKTEYYHSDEEINKVKLSHLFLVVRNVKEKEKKERFIKYEKTKKFCSQFF